MLLKTGGRRSNAVVSTAVLSASASSAAVIVRVIILSSVHECLSRRGLVGGVPTGTIGRRGRMAATETLPGHTARGNQRARTHQRGARLHPAAWCEVRDGRPKPHRRGAAEREEPRETRDNRGCGAHRSCPSSELNARAKRDADMKKAGAMPAFLKEIRSDGGGVSRP